MEIAEIVIGAILTVFVPGTLIWANSMQKQVSENKLQLTELRGDLKVNTSRDTEIDNRLTKIESELLDIRNFMMEIKAFMANNG